MDKVAQVVLGRKLGCYSIREIRKLFQKTELCKSTVKKMSDEEFLLAWGPKLLGLMYLLVAQFPEVLDRDEVNEGS
jgi:hypothetical protein